MNVNRIIFKKKFFLELGVITPLVILLCIIVTFRNQYLPDYQMYYSIYLSSSSQVEISYNLIASFFKEYNLGFLAFLFTYSFLGLGLHMFFAYFYLKCEQGWVRLLSFLLPYYFYLFIFWDLIQIRYSVGISFLLFGLFSKKNKLRVIFFCLAFAFHNSMILPILLYCVFSVIKRERLRLLMVPIIALVSLVGLEFTRYAVKYDESTTDWDKLNLLGGNCLMLYTLVIALFYFKNSISNKYKDQVIKLIYITSVLTLLIVILNFDFPAIANRLLALAIFFAFLGHGFMRGRKNLLFILLIAFVFSAWNFNIIVMDPRSFFNTQWSYS